MTTIYQINKTEYAEIKALLAAEGFAIRTRFFGKSGDRGSVRLVSKSRQDLLAALPVLNEAGFCNMGGRDLTATSVAASAMEGGEMHLHYVRSWVRATPDQLIADLEGCAPLGA